MALFIVAVVVIVALVVGFGLGYLVGSPDEPETRKHQ